jgi:replication factor A1
MKISELKAGQGKVDIEGVIKSKAEPRVFNKYGKDLRVCNAVLANETGEVTLSLWNDDVEKVNVGDTVKITNGYVSEFNGLKQLTSGKFGKLEVVGAGSASAGSDAESSAPKSAAKPVKSAKAKKEEVIEEQEF